MISVRKQILLSGSVLMSLSFVGAVQAQSVPAPPASAPAASTVVAQPKGADKSLVIAQATQSTSNPSTIAQTQPATTDRAKVDQATEVQQLVVTGSRIAKPNLDQPTPVTTLSPEMIENSGTANLGDIIAQLPEVGTFSTNRANSNNFGNSAGVSEIDLRNLGTSRTLVLVDGQRHVDGDISSDAVDINSIPSELVDHVEVITGGASAIYGSDAVSGVVNIILKHNFEGLEVEAQGGNYDADFGTQYSAAATIGHNFDFLGGRLNLTLSGFYNNEQTIYANQLPYDHNYGGITNQNDIPPGTFDPTYYTSGAAIPNDHITDSLIVPNVGSEFVTRNGTLLDALSFEPITLFNANGTLAAVPQRTGFNSFAFGQLPYCPDCYYPEQYNEVQSPLEQEGVEFLAHYDVNQHLHASLDAKFIDNHVGNTIQPDYTFGSYQISPDNAFASPALSNLIASTAAADAAASGTGAPASDFDPYYAKFLDDGRTQDIERRTYRIVGGLNGDFDVGLADIRWDGAVNYGQTLSHLSISGLAITQNFIAALDSVIDPTTGQPACRLNVPSAQPAGYTPPAVTNTNCVPYNPFGNTNSAAAMAYSFGTFLTRDQLSQEDANLNLNVDSSRFFNFQGGPIGLAFGGEYRMERTFEINDPGLNSGETDEATANSAGGFNVYEGYTEVNLPIFKNFRPGLEEFSIDGAYREAHYSTVGDVGAYKVSAIYGPVEWFKFRGTYSKSVRAPNITEAFSPISPGYFTLTDPCSAENIASNVNYARNCAAAGIPAGFTDTLTNASVLGQSSGNKNLEPERSLSYTGGFVVQPPFIPHLSVTVDYYSILIKNAITFLQGQDIVNNCYNSSTGLNSQYCSLFTRIPAGQLNQYDINFIQSTYVNAAKLFTDGVELQANYAINIEPLTEHYRYANFFNGHLDLSADVNYVLRLRNFPFQNNISQYNIEENGVTTLEGDVPNLRALINAVYRQGPVQFGWQVRYLGRAARYDQDNTQADFAESTSQPYAGAKLFDDISLRYDLPGHLKGFQVFMGVNDLFGDTPPLGLVQETGTDAAYDLGRYIYGGIKFRH